MPTYVVPMLGRLPLLAIGLVALYWQVQLIKEYYGGGSAIAWIAPLISIVVALCPHWAGTAFRQSHRTIGVGFLGLFVFLFLVSVMASIGRVGEFRAAKGSSAAAIQQQHDVAKSAVDRAVEAVRVASANVDNFCAATTTSKTMTREGSKKKSKAVSTQTVEADPRCDNWQAELQTRRDSAEKARNALAAVPPVPDANADAHRIAAMLPFLSAQTVEEWQPALMPLGLELIMSLVFPFAFRPLEYQVEEAPERSLPDNVVRFPSTDGLIMDVKVVAGLVALWINDEGLPVDQPIAKACERFNAWLKRQNLVSPKMFSKALDAAGVQKRMKGGRTLIANGSYKPRKKRG